ncbi:MAG: folylpolyglutamate synthase/dihydrofolate synthase family protein [Sphingomonas sp.]
MADRAASDHPGVQAQLDRLAGLSPGRDILGLERIAALLARLGDPQRALPPVLHVAGTNGKGSTCAFLHAAIEAAGLTAHVYTSPHLVRFNERIRLAGALIDDDALAALLAETLDAANGMEISFFEATTATAFLAFARAPADACIVEVGLGGRLDATNVIEAPLVCGIAALGHDHHAFLGRRITQIAAEKAGIAKAGAPLVTFAYPRRLAAKVGETAAKAGARWFPQGSDWSTARRGGRLHYRDDGGMLDLPLPRLPGRHQADNAALAVAMLRHQNRLAIPDTALLAAMAWTDWPARLQRLAAGPLRNLLPPDAELWLDGAHNPGAARAVARFAVDAARGRPLHLICGLLSNKDAAGILAPFEGSGARLQTVPVPGHDHHGPDALASIARLAGLQAIPSNDVQAALRAIAAEAQPDAPPFVLVIGSLYLAGEVLRANDQPPA